MAEDFLIQFGIDPKIPGVEEAVNNIVNAITSKVGDIPLKFKRFTIEKSAVKSLVNLISKELGTITIPSLKIGKVEAPQAQAVVKAPTKITAVTTAAPIKVKFTYSDALAQLRKALSTKTVTIKTRFNTQGMVSQINKALGKGIPIKLALDWQDSYKKLQENLKTILVKVNLDYADSLEKLKTALSKTPIQAKANLKLEGEAGKETSIKKVKDELKGIKITSLDASSGIEKFSKSQEKASSAANNAIQSIEKIQVASTKAKSGYEGLSSAAKSQMDALKRATASFLKNVAAYEAGSSQHEKYARSSYRLVESLRKIMKEEQNVTDIDERMRQATGVTFSEMTERLQKASTSFAKLTSSSKKSEVTVSKFTSDFEKLGREEREVALSMIKVAGSMDKMLPLYKRGSAYHANLIARKADYIAKLKQEMQEKGKLIGIEKLFQQATGKTINQQIQLGKEAARFAVTSGYGQESRFASIGQVAKNAFRRVAIWGTATAIFYGLVRVLRSVVDITKEVETRITELKKVMSSATTNFQEMKDAAFDMARGLGASINDVLDTMVIFGRQGLRQAEVIKMTRTSLLAANVTTLKVADAAESLTATIRQFNMSYSDSGKILDVWTNVASKNAVTAKQLAEAVALGGVAARTAGVNFEEYTAITSALAEATRQAGSTLGRALRMIFTRMYRPESLRALQEINIAVKEGVGTYRSAWDILSDLAKIWSRLTRSQQIHIASTMVGRRRYNDLVVILENWSRVLKALREAQTSAGAAELKNIKYMQTYEKQLSRLMASFEQLKVTIGKAGLLDILRGLSEMLRRAVPSLTGSIKTMGEAPVVAAATALAGSFVIAFGGRAARGIADSASVIFGEEVQRNHKLLALKMGKTIGAAVAGAITSSLITVATQNWVKDSKTLWGKVLKSSLPFATGIGAVIAGALLKQPLLIIFGISDAIQGLMPLFKQLAPLWQDQTDRAKEQLAKLMDQANVLEEITSLSKDIVDIKTKMVRGEATTTDLLLKQKELTYLIASQYSDIIAGIEKTGLVFGKTVRLGFKDVTQKYPVEFANKMADVAKKISGTDIIPHVKTNEIQKALDIISRYPEIARQTYRSFSFVAPEKTFTLSSYFSEKEQDLLKTRLEQTLDLLDSFTDKAKVTRQSYIKALFEKIRIPTEKRTPEVQEKIKSILSDLRNLEVTTNKEIDFATSMIRSSLASGADNIEETLSKRSDIVRKLILKYATNFNMLNPTATISHLTYATRRVLEKLFGLTEDKFKRAKLDEIIINWSKNNADAIRKGGDSADKAIVQLGSQISAALKKARVVVRDSLEDLVLPWQDLSNAIKTAFNLSMFSLSEFVSGLAKKMDSIRTLLEKKPTVGLAKAWSSVISDLNTQLRGLNIEALAAFPSPADFFKKAKTDVAPEIKTFVGEAKYGIDAFRKVLEVGLKGLDLKGLDKKVLRFFAQIGEQDFSATVNNLHQILWDIGSMKLPAPTKEWVRMVVIAQSIVKGVQRINDELSKTNAMGIDAADIFQQVDQAEGDASSTARYWGENQKVMIDLIQNTYDLMKLLDDEATKILSTYVKMVDIKQQEKNLVQTVLDKLKSSGNLSKNVFAALVKLGKDAYGSTKGFISALSKGFPSPFEKWRRDVLGVEASQNDLISSTETMLYLMSKAFSQPSEGLKELIRRYRQVRNEIENTKKSQQSLTDYYLMSGADQVKAAVAYTYLMTTKSKKGLTSMTDWLKDIVNKTPFLKALYEKKITRYFPELSVSSDRAAKQLKQVYQDAAKLLYQSAEEITKAFQGGGLDFSGYIKSLSEAVKTEEKRIKAQQEILKKEQDAASKQIEAASNFEESVLKATEISDNLLSISKNQESITDKFSTAVDKFSETVNNLVRSFGGEAITPKSPKELEREKQIKILASPEIPPDLQRLLEFMPLKEAIEEWKRISPLSPEAKKKVIAKIKELKAYPEEDITSHLDSVRDQTIGIIDNIRQQIEDYNRAFDFKGLVWDKLKELGDIIGKGFFGSRIWDWLKAWQEGQKAKAKNMSLITPGGGTNFLAAPTATTAPTGTTINLTVNIGDITSENPEMIRAIVNSAIDESLDKIEETVNKTLFRGQII